jgi:hypothetical protein
LASEPCCGIAVGTDALTLTWVVAGILILEPLVLIVFLVRVIWCELLPENRTLTEAMI